MFTAKTNNKKKKNRTNYDMKTSVNQNCGKLIKIFLIYIRSIGKYFFSIVFKF